MTPEATALQSRSEFYLCVARAFLPPKDENSWRGVTEYLADDLEALSGELGYRTGTDIAGLRAATRQFPDSLSLLQAYGRLFLTPPVAARLNTAMYLDGGIMGGATLAMQSCYRRHGLDGAPHFHDLPDHLSMQLEFVAFLWGLAAGRAGSGDSAQTIALADEARQFLAGFVRPALAPLGAELEAASRGFGAAALYLALVRILQTAVQVDCGAPASTPIAEGASDLA